MSVLAPLREAPPAVSAPPAPVPLRVLLVEDEDSIREMIRRYLEGKGMAVTPAAQGEEAWRLFQSGVYDAVVTDLLVPQLNGRQLVGRIRAAGGQGDVPVVMISASFLNARDEAACLGDLAVQAVFRKPLSLRDLAGSVAELGRHHRRLREAQLLGRPLIQVQAPPRRTVTQTRLRAVTSNHLGPLTGENSLVGLAAVANRCFQERVDGVLEVADGEGTRRITFHEGLVVATSSTVVEERLSTLLRDAGLVSAEHDVMAQHVMAREGGRYGYAVARAAGIPPSTVAQALEEQTLWVTMLALSRTSGTWRLQSTTDNPVLTMQLRMDPMEAVQRAALECVPAETARDVLCGLAASPVRRSPVYDERVAVFSMLRPDPAVVRCVSDARDVEDALRRAAPLPGGVNQLLALLLSGALTVEGLPGHGTAGPRAPVLGAFGGLWRPPHVPAATLRVREAIALEWLRTGGCPPAEILRVGAPEGAPTVQEALRLQEERFGAAFLDEMDLGPAKRVLAVVRLRLREAARQLEQSAADQRAAV
ncbi:MAG: response regulator [Deltaproteobacteria bacterium]|nr:response regulator [Deltaproteobacteria bacterium]